MKDTANVSMRPLNWYWCPTHEVKWVATYLHEHGSLHARHPCQQEGCTLVRVVTDPTDAVDLGAHRHDVDGYGCCRGCRKRVECGRCRNPYDEDRDAWGVCAECLSESLGSGQGWRR